MAHPSRMSAVKPDLDALRSFSELPDREASPFFGGRAEEIGLVEGALNRIPRAGPRGPLAAFRGRNHSVFKARRAPEKVLCCIILYTSGTLPGEHLFCPEARRVPEKARCCVVFCVAGGVPGGMRPWWSIRKRRIMPTSVRLRFVWPRRSTRPSRRSSATQ